MEFAALVAEFGARYGIGELVPDESGAVGFAVDGRQVVLQQPPELKDVATATVELCDAPDEEDADVNRLVMKANRALFLLDGMALVLHSETGRYCLLARFDVESLDFEGFDEMVGRVLERADQWGLLLERITSVDAAASEGDADGLDDAPPGLDAPGEFLRV